MERTFYGEEPEPQPSRYTRNRSYVADWVATNSSRFLVPYAGYGSESNAAPIFSTDSAYGMHNLMFDTWKDSLQNVSCNRPAPNPDDYATMSRSRKHLASSGCQLRTTVNDSGLAIQYGPGQSNCQWSQSSAMPQTACDLGTSSHSELAEFTPFRSPSTPMKCCGLGSCTMGACSQHLQVPISTPVDSSSSGKTPISTGSKRSYDQMSLSPGISGDMHSPLSENKYTSRESKFADRLLACPYWTRFPQRYSATNESEGKYQKCSCAKLMNLSRLKQHLYRNHSPPDYYCRRCFAAFRCARESIEHSQMSPVCFPRTCPWPEKISDEQHERIKRKRPGLSDYDGWYLIWEILFPGTAQPSTPYRQDIGFAISPQPPPAGMSSFGQHRSNGESPDRVYLRPRIMKASRILQQASLGRASEQHPMQFDQMSSFPFPTMPDTDFDGFQNETFP